LSSKFAEELLAKKELLNIIIQAFEATISKYSRATVVAQAPALSQNADRKDLQTAALICYEGKDFGAELSLQFPFDSIAHLYQSTFQMELSPMAPEMPDFAGELLNIAFGTIDPYFRLKGLHLRSSFPIRLTSQEISSFFKGIQETSIRIPFETSGKKFFLEIFPIGTFKKKWTYTPVQK
jgi:hypothetical protein